MGTLTISETGPFDVTLTAHAYIEKPGGTAGRYDVGICKGDLASPTFVGRSLWRPGTSASSFIADAVTITGFDANVTGPVTYTFCVAKFDGGAPDATVYVRGLNGEWSPH